MKNTLLTCLFLVLIMANTRADNPNETPPKMSEDAARSLARNLFLDNQLYRQGGIGKIALNVYVVANSANNELILGDRSRWVGKDKKTKEVVYIRDGNVCDPVKDQRTFSIADSILVAFEPEKIYIFDFKTFKGGFYQR